MSIVKPIRGRYHGNVLQKYGTFSCSVWGGGGGEAERLREGGGLRDRTAGIQMHSH